MSKPGDQSELPAKSALVDMVQALLGEAQGQGASSAQASASASLGLSVKARLGEIDTLTHHRNRSISIVVHLGQKKGAASSADWSTEAIRDTVAAALSSAQHTAEDAANGLPDRADLAADTQVPDLELDVPWPIDIDGATEMVRECEAAGRDADSRVTNSDGASLATGRSLTIYGNTLGFCDGYPTSRHSLSCSVIASESAGMQRGSWYSIERDPQRLQSAQEIGAQAAMRAVRRLGARRLSTRTCNVMFSPEVARGLLGHYIGALSGGSLYRKSSFLCDTLGQVVFSPIVTLSEQPHLPGALGSAPFDAEGVATGPRQLVADGRIEGYVLNSYSARRLGMHTTGNAGGIHNLLALATCASDDLLPALGTGLLVTQLMGQGVNMISGDYSRAATGFWVENGKIQYPVEECTVAGNLREMAKRVMAVGDDVDRRGVVQTGSIVLEGLVVSGKTVD